MRGTKFEDLTAIVDFLYFGEANVLQENLDDFLALAAEMQLKGLSGNKEGDDAGATLLRNREAYSDMPGYMLLSQQT